jgi:hypothetical protein
MEAMTLPKFYWCTACAAPIDREAFESGCPENDDGPHGRIGAKLDINRVYADLPSNRRASRGKKRGSSH